VNLSPAPLVSVHMRRLFGWAVAAAALSVLAVACGSSDNNTASPSGSTGAPTSAPETSAPGTSAAGTTAAPGGSQAEIEIEGFQYTAPASVSPGQSIKVVNKDGPEHSVTSGKDHSQFDVDVDGGGTGTFTAPSAPGTYDIICKYHSSMHGTLVVK
jgi:plastocyanin